MDSFEPLVKYVIFKNKYRSLHLDEVAKVLLGYGKLENKTGANIEEMSVEGRKAYCLQDVHIVSNPNEHTETSKYYEQTENEYDNNTHSMRHHQQEKLYTSYQKYKGGIVLEPIRGF